MMFLAQQVSNIRKLEQNEDFRTLKNGRHPKDEDIDLWYTMQKTFNEVGSLLGYTQNEHKNRRTHYSSG